MNSSADKPGRVPVEAGGVQINFCKNPACSNYGISPKPNVLRGPAAHGTPQDSYAVQGTSAGVSSLACRVCGEFPPIKSNAAIAEERDRFLSDLAEAVLPSCPDANCANHGVPVGKGGYQSFGITKSGSRRYRCKACSMTFSVGKSTTGHKQPHKNRLIFSLLMNKTPLRRICEVADIGPEGLYGKIDFLFEQTKAFAANREKRLLDGMPIRRLYLTTDRQDYVVNWTQHEDRRNVMLHAVGTADLDTRYVFGMHLNYDPSLHADEIELDAQAIGDYNAKAPFRRYARCWLRGDYDAAVRAKAAGRNRANLQDLQQSIEATYAATAQRADVEISETQDSGKRLPAKGMQIHAEYTLYGHFFFLKQLFGGVEKLRFFLDQDSGMRAACLAVFQPEIVARRADAFFVRIAKDRTISEKRKIVAASRAEFELARQANPGLSDTDIENLLIKERIAHMAAFGKWQDKWLIHPFPNMSEPERAACYLTDFGDYDADHLARLYNKASLHAIDCFFMQVRRRLSILERQIASASNAGRTWYGYSAYNPAQIVKMLGIFRVFYNYCLAGQDDKTPAMRLGLAKGKVGLEDIIYFG